MIVVAPPSVPATPNAPGSRIEWGAFPLVGGDTDYGVGVGQLSNVARLAPGARPYVWRIESGTFITFKDSAPGGVNLISPYQDVFVVITVPHFVHERLRFELRPSFTRETTQRYYGLGNASSAPTTDDPARDFYGRRHPTLLLRLRWALDRRWSVEWGQTYTENWFNLPAGGRLATQMRQGTPDERRLLGQAQRHGVYLSELSLLWDSRSNEIAPDRGQFHQLRLRGSPALGAHLPYAYGQVNLTLRFFVPVAGPRLGLAARTVFDGQFGDVPFYELARYEDTFALGGMKGVRGVPGQRYYGRVKAFANLELRSRWVSGTLFGKQMSLGGVLFFDLGRLWADWESHRELDGGALGLKYGFGGGLRLQQGQTFVVRADLAWSPDARPIGAYLSAGHIF